jgi:hypothetical protein
MPYLTHIPVDKARFVARLSAAEAGHLIQMSEAAAGGDKTSNRPIIVMKAESRVQYGGRGVVHIEGPLAGLFVRSRPNDLSPSVIDVNDLAEVLIQDASPVGSVNENPTMGTIGWATDHSGEGAFCMAVGLGADGGIIGFASLSGPGRGLVETRDWHGRVGVGFIAAIVAAAPPAPAHKSQDARPTSS